MLTNLAVINARSLAPKIASLTEYFEEKDLSFAIISESWLVEGHIHEEVKNELKHGFGLELIYTNRRPKNGRNTGGGICIVYRPRSIVLKKLTFARDGCEVIAGKGKLKQDGRTIVVIGVHIPPT